MVADSSVLRGCWVSQTGIASAECPKHLSYRSRSLRSLRIICSYGWHCCAVHTPGDITKAQGEAGVDAAKRAAGDAGDKARDLSGKAGDKANELGDRAGQKAREVRDRAADAADQTAEQASRTANEAKDAAAKAGEHGKLHMPVKYTGLLLFALLCGAGASGSSVKALLVIQQPLLTVQLETGAGCSTLVSLMDRSFSGCGMQISSDLC